MIIQRNSLPTPMMPPTLVSRVMGSIVRWEDVTSTSLSNVTNKPYLGQLEWSFGKLQTSKVHLDHANLSCRLSNPMLVVLYLEHSNVTDV